MFASQKRRKNASSVLIEIGFLSSGSNGVSGEQTLKRGRRGEGKESTGPWGREAGTGSETGDHAARALGCVVAVRRRSSPGRRRRS
ncbi:hypothetical protein Landi51_07073 [Colletotrichum acutatum]